MFIPAFPLFSAWGDLLRDACEKGKDLDESFSIATSEWTPAGAFGPMVWSNPYARPAPQL